MIDFDSEAEPVIFVRSKDAFYRLHHSNKGYKDVWRGFFRKATLVFGILRVFEKNKKCNMVDIAKTSSFHLDELADNGDFVMDQLATLPVRRREGRLLHGAKIVFCCISKRMTSCTSQSCT